MSTGGSRGSGRAVPRAGAVLGLLAALSYLALLERWFGDPGQPQPDGFLLRARTIWPLAVLTLALGAAWSAVARSRLRGLVGEARAAWPVDHRDIVALAAVIAAGIAYQLPLFLHPAGALESDSAVFGLIAKHVHDGRPAPAFVYGVLNHGTLSSHLLAAAWALTGPAIVGLLAVTRTFWFAFVAIEYVMLRAAFGRVAAFFAALWLALPPQFPLTHMTYADYPEVFAFGAATLAIAAARLGGALRDDLWYAVAGVVLGLGIWSQALIASVGAAVVLGIGLLAGRRQLWHAVPRLLAGATIGMLPALVGWGQDIRVFLEWVLGYGAGRARPFTDVGTTIVDTARVGLPAAFGHWGLGERPLEPLAAFGFTALLVAPAVWATTVGLRASHGAAPDAGGTPEQRPPLRSATLVLLGLVVLLHLLIFVLSPFNALVFPPRYLLPVYLGIPALAAAAVATLASWIARRAGHRAPTAGKRDVAASRQGRSRLRIPERVAAGAVAVVMSAWAVSGFPETRNWMREVQQRDRDMRQSVASLRALGLRYCEAHYWEAYWLSFVTLEEIICAPNDLRRDPYYWDVVTTATTGPYPDLLAFPDTDWLHRARRGLIEEGIPHLFVTTPTFEALLIEE